MHISIGAKLHPATDPHAKELSYCRGGACPHSPHPLCLPLPAHDGPGGGQPRPDPPGIFPPRACGPRNAESRLPAVGAFVGAQPPGVQLALPPAGHQ